jgi:hypothetical protein
LATALCTAVPPPGGADQVAPVHGVEVGVVGHAVEQGVDRRHQVDAVLGQLLEHRRQVARIGIRISLPPMRMDSIMQ